MAWLRRIDTARDEVAAVLEEVALALEDRVRKDARVDREWREFRGELHELITKLTIVQAKSMRLELEIRDAGAYGRAAYKRPAR